MGDKGILIFQMTEAAFFYKEQTQTVGISKQKMVAERSREWVSPKKTLVQGLQESQSCPKQLPVSRKDKTMRMTEAI